MMIARSRAFLVATVIAGILIVVVAAIRIDRPQAPRSQADKPLLLLTSLPLLFSEDLAIGESGSAVLSALDSRYRVLPISVSSSKELSRGRLLLMAQPRAQTAENLVALDAWVRSGGRLLLLADPMLEWESRRALNDVTRPPPMFMDTGLLAHWGVRLDTPPVRGLAERKLGGFTVMTVSPGSLHGNCSLSDDRLVARCHIGEGAVTIVADADLLNVDVLPRTASHNIDGVLGELASLESS